MKNFRQSLAAMIVFAVVASACTKKEQAPAPQAEATPAAAAAAAAPVDPNAKADFEIAIGTQGDAMAFDKTEFEVKAGSVVKVTFKNNASAGGLQHNFLVVKAGSEQAVANAGIQAGNDKGWIPAGDANVIAAGKLINAGETDTLMFTAPAAGDYPYICTFPGHAMVMKGTMHVK